MILKQYTITNQNFAKLHKEVLASNSVENFSGLVATGENFEVHGDSILNETALDSVVSNHDPIEVPEEITPRQARQALFLNGVTGAMIETGINSLSSPTKEMALIEWQYSIAFKRHNPLVITMASMLGWSSAQFDALWIQGSQL